MGPAHYTRVLLWCAFVLGMYQHALECHVGFHWHCHSMAAEDPAQGLWNPPDIRQNDSDLCALILTVLVDLPVVFSLLLVHLLLHSLEGPTQTNSGSHIHHMHGSHGWSLRLHPLPLWQCLSQQSYKVRMTPSLWFSVWWELKFRYWLMWIALWYTCTFTFLSSLREISAYRNGILSPCLRLVHKLYAAVGVDGVQVFSQFISLVSSPPRMNHRCNRLHMESLVSCGAVSMASWGERCSRDQKDRSPRHDQRQGVPPTTIIVLQVAGEEVVAVVTNGVVHQHWWCQLSLFGKINLQVYNIKFYVLKN